MINHGVRDLQLDVVGALFFNGEEMAIGLGAFFNHEDHISIKDRYSDSDGE